MRHMYNKQDVVHVSHFLVEMAGVEPASESALTGLSPGADDYCGNLLPCSPSRRQIDTRVRSGESHDAWHGQLFPYSRTPHQRRLPRPVASPVQTAALIRQQQQQCCCYLIYNCPFYGGQAPPPAYPASIPPSKPVPPHKQGIPFSGTDAGLQWKL